MLSPLGAPPPGCPGRTPRDQGAEPHPGLGALAHLMGRMARAPPIPMPMDRQWYVTPRGRNQGPSLQPPASH